MILPTPSVKALRISTCICEIYATKYDVLLNGKTSMLISYKSTGSRQLDPDIRINKAKVPWVNEVTHLGQS